MKIKEFRFCGACNVYYYLEEGHDCPQKKRDNFYKIVDNMNTLKESISQLGRESTISKQVLEELWESLDELDKRISKLEEWNKFYYDKGGRLLGK